MLMVGDHFLVFASSVEAILSSNKPPEAFKYYLPEQTQWAPLCYFRPRQRTAGFTCLREYFFALSFTKKHLRI